MKEEKSRYKRKGYGLIFASIFALSFFIGIPTIYSTVIWPEFIALKDKYELNYGTFFVIYSIF